MHFQNIPPEIQQYEQWVCYRLEKKNGDNGKLSKVPYCPQTARLASNKNPSQWTTFDHAVRIATDFDYYDGIGFVLTQDDPYCIIDFDPCDTDEQRKYQMMVEPLFDTYKEISPSNDGLHIVCKGSVPCGRKNAARAMEIYSSERYMTFTGNMYQPGPIKYQQAAISQLWEELGKGRNENEATYDGNAPATDTDLAVYNKAASAANGTKFVNLWNGHWQQYDVNNEQQSSGDQALMNILAFYTQNAEQLKRMFRTSALGKRDKANRDYYVNRTIRKSFDRLVPQVDLTSIHNELELFRASLKSQPMPIKAADPVYVEPVVQKVEERPAPTGWHDSTIPRPPGLMGLIADFILAKANRPVPEIAIAGAIGMMAGICGRAYNSSNTGLNQYVLLVARTGRGKDAIEEGISMIFESLALSFPQVLHFLGSGDFSSGPGLCTALHESETKSFVSIMDEFGLKLQQLSAPKVFGPDLSFKKMLLSLYTRSGASHTFRPTKYADSSRNFPPIRSPAVSIVGNAQPEVFYPNINELSINAGLIPRFLIIHYDGKRPSKNKQHAHVRPSPELLSQVAGLCGNALHHIQREQPKHVQYTVEAEQMLDDFDRKSDDICNAKHASVSEQLYTRADLKSWKLAGLAAVGLNPAMPIITPECVQWATAVISRDIEVMTEKFHAGEIGQGQDEFRQMEEVKRLAITYLTGEYADVARYNVSASMFGISAIPYCYFSKRCSSLSIFRNDVRGPTLAIRRALQHLVDNGDLTRLTKEETRQKFASDAQVFAIANVKMLETARAKHFS